jgi:poly(3-hydroxybutyrate) depolymerase
MRWSDQIVLSAGCSIALGLWAAACGSNPPKPSEQSEASNSTSTSGTGTSTSNVAGTAAQAGKESSSSAGQTGSAGSTTSHAGSSATTTAGSNAVNGTAGTPSNQGDAPVAGASGSASQAGAGGAPAEVCDKVIPPSMDCSAKLAPGDERTCMLGARKYIVHAGKTLNPCKPTALVIDAHGATETAEQQLGKDKFCAQGNICWAGLGSGWAAESDTPGGGFIAVFPQGNNNMWSASDADFMLMIVDEMKKLADIDPNKVYISGISNGGFLTFQTGCPHSDIFHGMSPNTGGTTCSSVKQPIPLISFDAMPDFAYSGHQSANMSVVTAEHCKGSAKMWLTVDSNYTEAVCRSATQDTMATLIPCNEVKNPIKPTVCKIWDDCDGGSQVVWCDVAPNTEHGASNASLDAHIIYENATNLNTPSLAWRFFKSFWK